MAEMVGLQTGAAGYIARLFVAPPAMPRRPR